MQANGKTLRFAGRNGRDRVTASRDMPQAHARLPLGIPSQEKSRTFSHEPG